MQLTLAVRRDFLRPQAILFREPHTDNDTLSLTHKATPTVLYLHILWVGTVQLYCVVLDKGKLKGLAFDVAAMCTVATTRRGVVRRRRSVRCSVECGWGRG
jgi:hypothetical protein